MPAVAEFDDTREKQIGFVNFFPGICVASIRAKVTNFRAKLHKLIKREKVGFKYYFLSKLCEA